jgi:Txe/YoeB family toxin of Txe-Axe toxin-antitoxin module
LGYVLDSGLACFFIKNIKRVPALHCHQYNQDDVQDMLGARRKQRGRTVERRSGGPEPLNADVKDYWSRMSEQERQELLTVPAQEVVACMPSDVLLFQSWSENCLTPQLLTHTPETRK